MGSNLQPSLGTCVLIGYLPASLPSTLHVRAKRMILKWKWDLGMPHLNPLRLSISWGLNSKLLPGPQSLIWPHSPLPYTLLSIPPTYLVPIPELPCPSACREDRLAHPAPPQRAFCSPLLSIPTCNISHSTRFSSLAALITISNHVCQLPCYCPALTVCKLQEGRDHGFVNTEYLVQCLA